MIWKKEHYMTVNSFYLAMPLDQGHHNSINPPETL